jgi:pilin isopeptide linkage protein
MNYGTDYEKTFGAHNYEEGYTPWTVTVKKTIPAGAVYEDKLSDEYVYHHQLFWFDDASLAATVIKFNGQTLVEGVDYTITGVRDSEDLANKYDPEGKHYNIFQITFNREIEATSSNPLTIEYKQILNTTAQDEGFYSIDGCTLLAYNYCRWGMPEYGEVVYPGYSANWNDSFQWNIPLLKDDSTYDADTGTITWYVTVNDKTSISGNATLEEYLPEGLSFVSATIEGKPDKNGNATNGYKFPNVTTKEFSTKLGDITQEEYTNEDGKTCVKVNIPITGLVAYYGQSVNFKDNVNNVGKYSGWSEAGMIMVKVVTKVDSDWYMNLSKDTTLTNTAVLTDNTGLPEGGVKATGTATVPHTTLIDKSMVNQDAPAYVEYALNINSGASTLAGDAGSLEIIDIMSSGMSFSTDHANNFKVYDVTGVSDDDLLDSDGNVIASKAQSLAIADVSSQCTIQDVTGQEFDGMTEDEIGKPTYLITVPDGKHLVVLYWAAFEGSEGDQVTVSNRASFFFNNAIQSGGGDETSDKVAARASSSTVFTGPFFNLKKSDQFGNLVEGVTYSLYEVSVDSDGNETGRTKLMTQTTDEDGSVYFGHRTGNGGDNYDPLSKNKLYCLIEESAPTGYALNSDPYYFEFKESGHDVVDHPSTVTLHQFVSGGTYSFTNQFTPASYSVPVKKTINGKTVSSDTEFSFTLTQTDGNKVYTDENYATEISKDGIQASIKGSGETLFDKLYFTETGEYTFSLTENDLSDEAEAMGYSKDTNSFEITVEIGTNADNELVVKKATFTSAKDPDTTLSLDTDVPTFDNGSYMTGTITLHATKEVTNRDLPVQEGEFAFTVSAGGEVVAETNEDGTVKLDENNKPVKKLFYTEEGGEINLEIPIDQDDVGTKTYIISEVDLGDPTIKYTTDRVRVQVTIAEDGKGGVEATNYKYLTDPAVFTNDYIASGSVTLEGTKLLKSESTGEALSLTKGEFNFIVKEGSTQVATGSNEADGSITFTEITYDASDIGTHTYVISEKNEGLNYIEYTDQTVTAQVTVTDAGDGKLAADVQYIDGTLDDNGHALFTNISTLIVPSGIRTDILPFAFVFVVAGSLGVAMIIRIRRRRRGLR